MRRESGDDVIYDPLRLRGISTLAMPSQDLNITPYSTQPVVRAPHRCYLRMAQYNAFLTYPVETSDPVLTMTGSILRRRKR